jgi:hypothetical protein
MFHAFLLPRGPRSFPEKRAGAATRPIAAPHDLARRLTVRLAEPADGPALRRLAELDSARLPSGTLLVGEVGGAIQAAVPVRRGRAIANPFVPTAELVTLLELRAAQLRELGVGDGGHGRVIPLPRRRLRPVGRTA